MPPRLLIVDSRGRAGRDRARSRGEALQQLAENEYDAIELHTTAPGRDDYGLVAYLAATWPQFLQQVTLRTITRGRASAEWHHESARFIIIAPSVRTDVQRREREQAAAEARV
ncbi:MAG TPA: hypothetical protein VFN10_07930 [Thermoanaerobaculia bacterium]|nr:hypothetical protein [Thermoanaerobaculia bacterium]